MIFLQYLSFYCHVVLPLEARCTVFGLEAPDDWSSDAWLETSHTL